MIALAVLQQRMKEAEAVAREATRTAHTSPYSVANYLHAADMRDDADQARQAYVTALLKGE